MIDLHFHTLSFPSPLHYFSSGDLVDLFGPFVLQLQERIQAKKMEEKIKVTVLDSGDIWVEEERDSIITQTVMYVSIHSSTEA